MVNKHKEHKTLVTCSVLSLHLTLCFITYKMVYGVSFAGWLVYVLPECADRFVIPSPCKKMTMKAVKLQNPRGSTCQVEFLIYDTARIFVQCMLSSKSWRSNFFANNFPWWIAISLFEVVSHQKNKTRIKVKSKK